MTRHRLMLAIVAAVLCGVACWLSLDRLSAEERLLVGTWTFDANTGSRLAQMRFSAHRRYAFGTCLAGDPVRMVDGPAKWSVRDGAIVLDGEPSAVRRVVRLVLRGLGLPCNGTVKCRLKSITPDELVLVNVGGTRETWTRAPAD
jgi:hypothetical protein